LADAAELCNRGVQFLQDNRAACFPQVRLELTNIALITRCEIHILIHSATAELFIHSFISGMHR